MIAEAAVVGTIGIEGDFKKVHATIYRKLLDSTDPASIRSTRKYCCFPLNILVSDS